MKTGSILDLITIILFRIVQIALLVVITILLFEYYYNIDIDEAFIFGCMFICAELMLNNECDKIMEEIKSKESENE